MVVLSFTTNRRHTPVPQPRTFFLHKCWFGSVTSFRVRTAISICFHKGHRGGTKLKTPFFQVSITDMSWVWQHRLVWWQEGGRHNIVVHFRTSTNPKMYHGPLEGVLGVFVEIKLECRWKTSIRWLPMVGRNIFVLPEGDASWRPTPIRLGYWAC